MDILSRDGQDRLYGETAAIIEKSKQLIDEIGELICAKWEILAEIKNGIKRMDQVYRLDRTGTAADRPPESRDKATHVVVGRIEGVYAQEGATGANQGCL